MRYEFGALSKLTFKKTVAKNVDLKSTLDLFTAYSDSFGNRSRPSLSNRIMQLICLNTWTS